MGYNTTVNILNDALDQIQKYPEEFVQGILRSHNYGGGFGVGCHANPVEVARSEHADVFQLHAVYGNSLVTLNAWNPDTKARAKRNPDMMREFIRKARAELDWMESRLGL